MPVEAVRSIRNPSSPLPLLRYSSSQEKPRVAEGRHSLDLYENILESRLLTHRSTKRIYLFTQAQCSELIFLHLPPPPPPPKRPSWSRSNGRVAADDHPAVQEDRQNFQNSLQDEPRSLQHRSTCYKGPEISRKRKSAIVILDMFRISSLASCIVASVMFFACIS